MLNHVVLHGRLVKDPEIRYTQNRKAVADIRIAVERDIKNSNGGRDCDFFGVVAFGLLAEHIGKFYHKGDPILVAGRLQQEEWQDRDGNKRATVEVLANNVWFTQSKKDGAKTESPAPVKAPSFTPVDIGDDGDFPF